MSIQSARWANEIIIYAIIIYISFCCQKLGGISIKAIHLDAVFVNRVLEVMIIDGQCDKILTVPQLVRTLSVLRAKPFVLGLVFSSPQNGLAWSRLVHVPSVLDWYLFSLPTVIITHRWVRLGPILNLVYQFSKKY